VAKFTFRNIYKLAAQKAA